MSLRRLECRSASLVMLGSVSLFGFRIWGQVLSPPTGGYRMYQWILCQVLCVPLLHCERLCLLRHCVWLLCVILPCRCVFCIPGCLLCVWCCPLVVRGVYKGGGWSWVGLRRTCVMHWCWRRYQSILRLCGRANWFLAQWEWSLIPLGWLCAFLVEILFQYVW